MMVCETIYFVAFIGLGFFLEYILAALLIWLENKGVLHPSFDKNERCHFDIGSYVIFVFVSFYFLLYYVDFFLLKFDGIVYALLLGCTGLFIRIIFAFAERVITALSKILLMLIQLDFEKFSKCWKELLDDRRCYGTILKWAEWDNGISDEEKKFTWLILSIGIALSFLIFEGRYEGNTQLDGNVQKAVDNLIVLVIGYFVWIDINPCQIFGDLLNDLRQIKGRALFVLFGILAMILVGIGVDDLSGKFSIALLIGIIIGVMKDQYEKNKLLKEDVLITNNKENESHNPSNAS